MSPKTLKELKDFVDDVYQKSLLDNKEIKNINVFDNTKTPLSKPILDFGINELGEVFFFT